MTSHCRPPEPVVRHRIVVIAPLILLVALLVAPRTSALASARPVDTSDEVLRVDVPLHDGRLAVADLFRALRHADDRPARFDVFEHLDWTVPADRLVTRLDLDDLHERTGGTVSVEADDERLRLVFDGAAGRAHITDIGRRLRERLVRTLTPPWSDHGATYGIRRASSAMGRIALDDAPPPPRVVLLVHGLDAPSWQWRDAVPPLMDSGRVVLVFDYPNDGPIDRSADLLVAALRDLRRRGVVHVDAVGHSMGGLVLRDVLTRPAYYAGDGRGSDDLPAIDTLVMLGTPNHGSAWAKYRGVVEIRDQVEQFVLRGGSWAGPEADGDGEAGVDLLPESAFLTDLNARPLATFTRHVTVAAHLSPAGERTVETIADRALEMLDRSPAWLRELAGPERVEQAADDLRRAVHDLGDGVVSMESVWLDGVTERRIVVADHMSMIVNLLPGGDVPPAVPLLLEILPPGPPVPADGDE
ncbi:MAG: hypothetical protein KDA25_00995 [Phycisphaerales bacterium]|nr:hypothetical protein [Phycisphaerales bacterium]